MSNKYIGLYVTFENEISEEYLDIVRHLIGSIKGVISVKEQIGDMEHWFAKEQVKHEIKMKLFEILK